MATPPYNPFPVSGIAYDTDGTTKLTAGTIYIENRTKSTRLTLSVASNGEFTGDLANLSTGWDSSDVIYASITQGNKSAEARLKISSTDTSWELNLYLKSSPLIMSTFNLTGISASVGATAKTFSLMNRDSDDAMILQINVAADGNTAFSFPDGIKFSGGIRILQAALNTNANTVSAGTTIGDNATSPLINVAISGTYIS